MRIWAYCLIPNPIHLIAAPETKDGLNPAIGEAHRRYTRRINFREGLRGHLWQGRFSSFIMQEPYLLVCTKEELGSLLDRQLKRQKPGPKKKISKVSPEFH